MDDSTESNRIPVTLEQMSPILIDAILVAVDPNYLTRKRLLRPLAVAALKETSSETFSHSAICEIVLWCAQHSNSSAREISSVVYLERTYPSDIGGVSLSDPTRQE